MRIHHLDASLIKVASTTSHKSEAGNLRGFQRLCPSTPRPEDESHIRCTAAIALASSHTSRLELIECPAHSRLGESIHRPPLLVPDHTFSPLVALSSLKRSHQL